MILVGKLALCWLASVVIWTVIAFARERRTPDNYHEFCEVWGLCCFWLVTFALEGMLAWYNRKA